MNVSWQINGTEVQTTESVTEASYTNTSPSVGTWNVSAVVTNENGTAMQTWRWNVSLQVSPTPTPTPGPTPSPSPITTPTPSPTPLLILSSDLTPPSPFHIFGFVFSIENSSACTAPFVVITNLNTSEELVADNRTESDFYQVVTSSTFVNAGDVLQINASKNGTSIGTVAHIVNQTEIERGIIVEDINTGMPDLVIPESGISIPPLLVNKTNVINVTVWNNGTCASGTFNVSFSVSRENETGYENGTRIPGLELGSYINIPFPWKPPSEGSYNITASADSNHEINESNELNNNLTIPVFVGVPDFAVNNITFNRTEPLLIGDIVEINATIANTGDKEGTTNVEFYDSKSIEITRTWDEYLWGQSINDTLILPEALKIRVHFSYISGWVMIYDKNDSRVELLSDWTDWASDDTIRIESQSAEFTVDRYEALLANVTVPIDAGNHTTIPSDPVKWNLSDQYMGWATSGEHNITVMVDPSNQITESNEKNNTLTEQVTVNPSLDFTVTNISFNDPLLNETVELNATVANYGVRNGTATVRAYCDDIIVNETAVPLNFTDLPRVVDMWWVANITDGGAGRHNISVEIDPDNVFVELNETNNTLPPQEIFVNGTDLAVLSLEIPCGQFGGRRCYRDKNETITVTIANLGARDASNFTVMLSDGLGEGNTSGTVFFSKTIPRLNSSESKDINVTWAPGEFGKHTITISIPFDNTDNNETNNKLFENISVKPEYDFAVEDVRVSPVYIKEGGNVTINATIANLGLKDGSVNVSFYVNSTDFVGSKDERYIEIGRTGHVDVESDKNKSVPITWRANITGGDHLIYVVVDPDNKVAEWPCDLTKIGESIILKDPAKAGNNVKSCVLHVLSPQLHITNLTLDPSKPVIENKVNVTAVIENKGNETVNSTVGFYVAKNLGIRGKQYATYDWDCLISQPEDLPIRVHLKYIDIDVSRNPSVSINAYVDAKLVNFIVKSIDVAKGQPIKVSEINFDSPCGDCKVHNANGICTERRWEDVWTEWTVGKTIEVKAKQKIKHCTFGFLIDKYQVQLGNETFTLPANSNASYNATWNASLPLKVSYNDLVGTSYTTIERSLIGENHTLIANVEDEVATNETYLYGTDLAVTDLEVNNTYFDGDEVNITAVIENLGLKNATEFWVNLTEYYINTVGNKVIVETKPIFINGLNASEYEDVLPVNWTLNASRRGRQDYTIEVKINSLNNKKYEEKTNNNLKEKDVHVKRARDFYFSIQNLSFAMNNETLDAAHLTSGINVTVNATLNITNLANRGGETDVSFYVDRVDNVHEIGNDSVDFAAGNGTGYAEITWYVWDFDDVRIGGNHTIIVVADPENNIDELNESNNTYIQPIHVNAPELTITNITFEPEPDKKEINESVNMNISVGVANYGDKNATNVSLVVYDCANRHIENTDSRVYGSLHPGQDKAQIKRENATAMRLYLDTDIDMGKVSIRNGSSNQIEVIGGSGVIFKDELSYYENFHGWTPWIIGNDVTIEAMGNASARVSKVYYLEPSEDATNTIYNLSVNRTEEKIIPIFDNWTAPTVGERLIVATIDPENKIQEYNELNNTFARYITVNNNTPDLSVKDIGLWLNGTQIGENDTVRDNDTVRIVANITNIGVNETENFSVRMLIDDDELLNETANWTATVGKHVLKAEVDYGNEIDETNETNNIAAMEIYVHGAEVSGNATWKSEGLHGLTGTILFDPAQPYDEDNVNISAVINNSGEVNATNFSVALLFDYKPADTYPPVTINNQLQNSFFGLKTNNTISYGNAISIYVYIDTHNKTLLEKDAYGHVTWHQVLTVYDKNDTEVARTDETCWVHVPGDTVKIKRYEVNELFPYDISFYPVYKSNLTRDENLTLNTNSSTDVSITVRNVTAGNHSVFLLIDPGGKVPEDVDNKSDNIVTREMQVLPTMDFTVTEVIPETENISDVEKINITANVTNIGLKEIAEKLSNKSINLSCRNGTAKVYRNGTTKVRFVDYETETRIHKFYLNNSLPGFLRLSDNLSYLPVSPGETLLDSHKNLTIIYRPGVDAIKLNFSSIAFDIGKLPLPEIHVFNKTGVEILWANVNKEVNVSNGDTWEYHKLGPTESLLSIVNKNLCPGDTAYIYTINTNFNLRGYTTMKEFRETDVTLNASVAWDESGNITDLCGESKNIPALWNASTGTHNITVTIDPYDETSEINETNNTYVRTLSVNATKELGIVDLNYSVQNPAPGQDPWHPGHGDNVTITAVVRNSGTATANFSVDLWMEVIRDNISSAPPNDWNISLGERSIPVGEETVNVKRIKYIKLLNHTELSLAPGESKPVNATWANISVDGNPEYVVKAIVDPLGEIREKNESNNDMEREIRLNYPDLTVLKFHSPTREDTNASVEIANEGVKNASENFNVSLEMIKHEYRTLKTGSLNISNASEPPIVITMKGASKIRVHFASLDTAGANSYIEIRGIDEDGKLHHVETYAGKKKENVWTSWWDGDTISIEYTNANFYIDGYGCGNVYSKEGASKIRICFNSLDTTGVNSYIDIQDGEGNRVKTYRNEETGYVCTPWVDGNTTIIDYANAFYDVKELWWKDEAIRMIEELNASDSTNITLLEGGKYERLMNLNVSVDPPDVEHLYGGVIEQREDNNTGTALIYADLIPKAMNLDYTDGGQLKTVTATIANDKTLSEDEGIVYPVYDFNVSLEVRPWNNDTVVYEESKRIDENQTIYGGEERNVTFDINESELRTLGLENKTCNFTVVADSKQEYSWGEIEEIKEGNNEYPVTAGPDLSVGEIYTEPAGDCNCKVGAVIKNEGNRPATDFDVRLILNSTSGNETWDETIPSLGPNSSINWTFQKYPYEILDPNRIYNVTVIVDPTDSKHPRGRVEELNEGNNEHEPNPETIGPDLTPKYMIFYFKNGNKVAWDKLVVRENLTVKIMVENAGKVGAKNFSVAINVSNVTVSSTKVTCLPGGEEEPVELFNWAMPQRGFYNVSATVDIPDNVVNETWKKDGEDNNRLPPTLVKVAEPNYKATKTLTVLLPPGTVDGGVYFDASGPQRTYNASGSYQTTFENRIPVGATPVYARLYLYLWGREEDPDHANYFLGKLPEVDDMEFIVSEHPPESVGSSVSPISEEFPDATRDNYTYATYAYDIPQSILNTTGANDSLEARASFNGTGVDFLYGVAGMGLFVAYNDGDGLLTEYYTGEGGDIIMAKNNAWPTGFEYDECTSIVEFKGVEDPQLANATLITVLSQYQYYPPIDDYYGDPFCDLLLFNNERVGEPIFEQSGEGHFWKYHTAGDIALIWDEERGERGEYVDVEANNWAAIQSRGSYFFLTNAILNVTWWPDLEPYVETQLKATVGNPYEIPIDINNWGLSKAKDFNVSVSIDGEEYNETIDEIEGAVGYQQQPGSKTLTFTKKAQLVETTVQHNVTVKVDTRDSVKELINKHGRGKQGKSNGEENNEIINKTVTVEVKPSWGRLSGDGDGDGEGEGTGSGEGSGSGSGGGGTTGGAGGAVGGTGGETITGRLMKGTAAWSEEEGGGRGEFSLVAWLLRLVMLAAAGALVGVGYLHERRRQNNKLSLEKKV